MTDPLHIKTLFEFCSQQLSSELRRFYGDTYIRKLNQELERVVSERTHELEQTIDHLQEMQQKLIQAETMAALSTLVAGVAHKLNTPIANASLCSESLHNNMLQLKQLATKARLSKKRLEGFIEQSLDGSLLIISNIKKASDLIGSFKELTEQATTDQPVRCAVADLLRACQNLLSIEFPALASINWCTKTEQLVLQTHPHLLKLVLLHILTNALRHAFEGIKEPRIDIEVVHTAHNMVKLAIKDNGVGIPAGDIDKVFDPFFTSHLNQGTSGLGLHLCYNLMTGPLQGSIEAFSVVGKGSCFTLYLPLTATKVQSQ